jgi:SAM-dependent methyltransferase
MEEYFNANRALWDEYALIHVGSKSYRVPAFKTGRSSLKQLELNELGPVEGRSLLHLQCHFGLDTLSWARLGAQVTGVDFSAEGVKLARSLADELNLPARFIQANIYDLPQQLDETFDIVFTSYGVLTWLPDLTGWAKLIARYLRPGGVFYIAEFHPFAMIFDDEGAQPQLKYPYFERNVFELEVHGSYADPDAQIKQPVTYEWNYPLGEVINALIQAGLQIEFLHEHAHSVYHQFPFLVETDEPGIYRFPPGMVEFPLMFSLRAHKPVEA